MADVTWTGPKGSYSLPDTPENAAKMQAAGYSKGDTMERVRGLSGAGSDSMPDLNAQLSEAAFRSQLASQVKRPMEGGPTVGEFARGALPSLAAGAASALVPEAAPVAWLLKALAAGGASAATDAGIQTARGQVPDATSLGRGALDAGGDILGGLLGKGATWSGKKLMGSALNVPKGIAQNAVDIYSELKGAPVMPHTIDLPEEALKGRIAPGPGPKWFYPESGAQAMTDTQAELMKQRVKHLADADAKGITFTRQDFTQHLSDLRRRVASGPNGTKNSETLQALIDDFIAQGRNPSRKVNGRTVQGTMKRIPPSEAEALKEQWQDWAKTAYKNASDDKLAVLDKFSEAIAKGIKEKVASLTPPPLPGAVGEIERLNRAYRANIPLTDAMMNAEMPRASLGSIKDINPLHALSPGVRGRAGLLLTEPLTQFGLRQGPRAAGVSLYELMQLMRDRAASSGAALDSTYSQ